MDRCNRACSISLGNIGFCKSKIYDSPIKQDFNEQQQQQQHGDVEYIGDEARHNLSVGCMCSSVKYILAGTIWLHFTPDWRAICMWMWLLRYRPQTLVAIQIAQTNRLRHTCAMFCISHLHLSFLCSRAHRTHVHIVTGTEDGRDSRALIANGHKFRQLSWSPLFHRRSKCSSSSSSSITNCGWKMHARWDCLAKNCLGR